MEITKISFQIVSEFIDTFVKSFMSQAGTFDPLFCLEGRVFVHNDCPRGGFLPPWSMSRGFILGDGFG